MTSSAPGAPVSWKNLKTGILFTFGVVVVGAFALLINRNSGVLSSHHIVHVYADNIRGLATGNPVQIAGMKVGTVAGMEFARIGQRTGVKVELDIRSEFFPMITSDSKATIRTVGMLGDKYVDIELGSSARTLADGGTLPLEYESGMNEMMASGLQTLNSVGEASDKLNGMLAKVERGEGTLGRLVNSDELMGQLEGTLAELRGVSSRLSSRDGLLWTLTEQGTSRKVVATIDALAETSTQLGHLAGSLTRGDGTVGRLLNDTELYDQLVGTARRTDSLIILLSREDGPLRSISTGGELYTKLDRSIAGIDSLIADVKARPGRYLQFSVFR